MGLCNVYNFSKNRTVKLSDAYSVKIKLTDTDKLLFTGVIGKCPWLKQDNMLELPECISVSLPEVSLKSETYKYGNNSMVYVYPDYEKPEDLKIELIEHVVTQYTETNTKYVGVVELLVNIFLNKLFDAATFSYKLNDYIPELRVTVYKNNFKDSVFEYIFKNLKLSTYSKYTLDYSSNDICKWSLSFSYQAYSQEATKEAEEISNQLFGENKAVNIYSEPPAVKEVPPAPEHEPDEPTEEIENAENNTAAIDSPIDNSAERADELAYKMMRGELGNGKARKEAAKAAGYTDEEIAAAQQIVNQKDWKGLKARHDAREASKSSSITPDNTKSAATESTPPEQPKAKETEAGDPGMTNAATLANAQDLAATDENSSNVVQPESTTKSAVGSENNNDRVDELAYQMMRGTYDNGKPRIENTKNAGYTEEEHKAAQAIVNQKDWNGLKERHDARVAAEEERKTEALANKNNGLSREPAPRQPSPVMTGGGDTGGSAAAVAAAAVKAEAEAKEEAAKPVLTTVEGQKAQDKAEAKKAESKPALAGTTKTDGNTTTTTTKISRPGMEVTTTKTTTVKADGTTETKEYTSYEITGFNAEREKAISEYATKRYQEELKKGKIKNEQMLITMLTDEARQAYAEGRIK